MKKVSLVLFDKYRAESLTKLRDIGVVHLENLEGAGDEYEKIYYRLELLNDSLIHISSVKTEPQDEYCGIEDALQKAEAVLKDVDELKSISDKKTALLKELERIQPLGDFDPAEVAKLTAGGVETSIFDINRVDEKIFSDTDAFRVGETKSRVFYAVFGELPEALSGFDKMTLPEKSISDLSSELAELDKKAETLLGDLQAKSSYRKLLLKAVHETESELRFEEVRSGIGVDQKLSYLRGFCPEPAVDNLKSAAAENGWGLMLEDPAEEDEVPTQLKLGKFASLLTPITDFLGILPGYREYDISFFFLCFFSVFTAMLIGDGGYGMLFLVITIAGMIGFGAKTGKIPKIFFLLLLLSVSTIIYGAVSGTWFASKSIMSIPFFDNLKLDAFKVDESAQIALVMGISFFLGIVQLLIGVVQNFRKNFPALSSFAQIGWFAVLVAIYYLVLTLVVKRAGLETYPKQMLYILLGGVAVIFVFGSQEQGKSFIKGIISSFANFLNLFLNVVGTFSDIMSYVRLFAVGLASVKIAETFNQLGAQMSHGPIIIFGIIIVLLGHTINIVLGLMAILVHAVRLNILEYSGKVGVEWSGFKYEPFENK